MCRFCSFLAHKRTIFFLRCVSLYCRAPLEYQIMYSIRMNFCGWRNHYRRAEIFARVLYSPQFHRECGRNRETDVVELNGLSVIFRAHLIWVFISCLSRWGWTMEWALVDIDTTVCFLLRCACINALICSSIYPYAHTSNQSRLRRNKEKSWMNFFLDISTHAHCRYSINIVNIIIHSTCRVWVAYTCTQRWRTDDGKCTCSFLASAYAYTCA